jgi:hypothetical protein
LDGGGTAEGWWQPFGESSLQSGIQGTEAIASGVQSGVQESRSDIIRRTRRLISNSSISIIPTKKWIYNEYVMEMEVLKRNRSPYPKIWKRCGFLFLFNTSISIPCPSISTFFVGGGAWNYYGKVKA